MTAQVHLLWTVANEEVLVAEVSEVEEEEVVQEIHAFNFRKGNVPSVKAVDSHMTLLEELHLVLVAVSEEVQTTVPLKEVEDHALQHLADSREAVPDTASQWDHWGLLEDILRKEVRLVTVSQAVLVVKEVSQVVTVLRVYSQELTVVRPVRLVNKVFTVIAVGTVKVRRVASNSRWGAVVDSAHSLQEHMVNLQVTRSKAPDQATHHLRVDTSSKPMGIQVAQPTGSN